MIFAPYDAETSCRPIADRHRYVCLNKYRIIIFGLVAATCSVRGGTTANAQNILVLHSYHQGYKWTDNETAGIMATLMESRPGAHVFYEYMQSKWVKNKEEYFRFLSQVLERRYSAFKLDVIITTDQDAFEFMKEYHSRLFPTVPVVCGTLFEMSPKDLEGYPMFTGVREAFDYAGTIDLILKIHPKTKRICVVMDISTVGERFYAAIRKISAQYGDKVKFSYLHDVTEEELFAGLRALPPETIVFYGLFLKDKTGRMFNYDDICRKVANASQYPLYSITDINLGDGIVGGMMTSAYEHGKMAARLALRILDGENVRTVPFQLNVPSHPMFDYDQLKRFNISRSLLPADSTIINEPPSYYTVNQGIIWIAAGGMLTLLVIIFLLAMIIYQKKKAERFMLCIQDQLETRVKARTSELVNVNQLLLDEIADRINMEMQLEGKNREMETAYCELHVAQNQMLQSQKLEAIGQLAAGIAHEINTPIQFIGDNTSFIGHAADSLCKLVHRYNAIFDKVSGGDLSCLQEIAALRREADTEYVISEIPLAVRQSMDGVRRVTKIVNALTDFAREDATEKTYSNLNKALQDTLVVCENEWKKIADLDLHLDPHLPFVCCNIVEINQVIMNLVVNACRAIERKQAKTEEWGRICIATRWHDQYAEIAIGDNGDGIPADAMSQIFNPFFTTEDIGKGMGHGLAISHHIIVEKHHGHIDAVSDPKNGTIFTIRLPIKQEEPVVEEADKSDKNKQVVLSHSTAEVSQSNTATEHPPL